MLPLAQETAIIYLVPALLHGSICLPSNRSGNRTNGRAARKSWFTWHFSMQGLPPATITCCDRKLLPHVFTLTPHCKQIGAVIFCGTICSHGFRGTRVLAGALLYAVRTFLPISKMER